MEALTNHLRFQIFPCISGDGISLSERIWCYAPNAMTTGAFVLASRTEKRTFA